VITHDRTRSIRGAMHLAPGCVTYGQPKTALSARLLSRARGSRSATERTTTTSCRSRGWDEAGPAREAAEVNRKESVAAVDAAASRPRAEHLRRRRDRTDAAAAAFASGYGTQADVRLPAVALAEAGVSVAT